MDHNTNMAAMNVALFCRLNLNKKCCIPIRHSEMGVLIYANLAKEPVTPRYNQQSIWYYQTFRNRYFKKF